MRNFSSEERIIFLQQYVLMFKYIPSYIYVGIDIIYFLHYAVTSCFLFVCVCIIDLLFY
jgi:hypothetical protein